VAPPPLEGRGAGRVFAILLAAGSARRFGGGKLTTPVGGIPLVRHATLALLASGAVDVVLVATRTDDDAVADALCGLDVRIVRVPNAEQGMSRSLRVTLAAAAVALAEGVPGAQAPSRGLDPTLDPTLDATLDLTAAAVLVALGDQPGLAAATVQAVVERWRGAPAGGRPAVVLPAYRDGPGHPVLFDRALWPELFALEGDEGARSVVRRDPARVASVMVDTPAPQDVDTRADLARVTRIARVSTMPLPLSSDTRHFVPMPIAIPRPAASEYAPFYARYVAALPEGELLPLLDAQHDELQSLLAAIAEPRGTHRYAPGKWSIKELVGHLTDTERIFTYRLLCAARGDATPLPGFDENAYVPPAEFDARPLASIAAEAAAVRRATLALLDGLPASAHARQGNANGAPISVRAIAWIIAGHERHHLQVLRERYL